jgi:hypothetical protein
MAFPFFYYGTVRVARNYAVHDLTSPPPTPRLFDIDTTERGSGINPQRWHSAYQASLVVVRGQDSIVICSRAGLAGHRTITGYLHTCR